MVGLEPEHGRGRLRASRCSVAIQCRPVDLRRPGVAALALHARRHQGLRARPRRVPRLGAPGRVQLAGATANSPKAPDDPGRGLQPGLLVQRDHARELDGRRLTFTHAAPPAHLVASVAYTVRAGDRAVRLLLAEQHHQAGRRLLLLARPGRGYGAQQVGACVMRTKNPANPASWRAWDGTGYNVQFIDPYTNPQPPEQHVCTPVAFPEIEKMVAEPHLQHVLREVPAGRADEPLRPGHGRSRLRLLLLDLDRPDHTGATGTLLMEAELPVDLSCGDDDPVPYPVVLESGQHRRATSRPRARQTYLYFTRFNYVQLPPTSTWT